MILNIKDFLNIKIMSLSQNDNICFQIIDWYTDNYEQRDNLNENSESDDSDKESDIQSDSEYDSDDSQNRQQPSSNYKIYIFGKDLGEKTYTLEVDGFTPYFYVRVPDHSTDYHKKELERYVRDKLWVKHKSALIRSTLHSKHSFRDFDNFKKYKFVRLVFSNTDAMRCAVNIFQNREYNEYTKKTKRTPKKLYIPSICNRDIYYDLYENNIDPLIKFIHHKKIKTVGWIKIARNKFEILQNSNNNTDYALRCRWTDIKVIDKADNSKIKILAYDIECDSAHGDFPIPIKDYTKLAREIYNNYMKINQQKLNFIEEDQRINKSKIDKLNEILENREQFAKERINYAFNDGSEEHDISKIYTKTKRVPTNKHVLIASKKIAPHLIISENTNSIEKKRHFTKCINKINYALKTTFDEVEGDKTIQIGMSFLNYGSTVPYRNIMLTLGSCKKINNAEVISYKKEELLLLKFRDLIIAEDPDIITGYNIDGFDTPWLFKRAKELDIESVFNKMSRFTDFHSEIKTKMVKSPTNELIEKEYVELPGRIQMDLLPLIQKGFNLESYKLDNVSATFINGKIKSIQYNEEKNLTEIETNSVKGLNIGNYIVFNEKDGYLENKFMDGKKFQIKDLDTKQNKICLNEDIKIEDFSRFRWCLGKDDVTPQDIFRLQKGNSKDRSVLAYYCMMDVILCLELLLKLELLTNTIGMANVCLNPLAWIIHRGQGVKILSLVANFLKDKNYLLPYLYKDTFDKEGYEGAVVLTPKPGIYIDEPVSVLDYASLYPSSMIERNLSHETIVVDEKYMGEDGAKNLDKLGYDYEDVNYDTFKTIFTPAGSIKSKIKTGVKTVRFVQFRDGTKGIIPQILRYLLNARKTTRLKIKYRTIKTIDGDEYIGLYDEKKEQIKLDSTEILSNPTIIDLKNKKIISNEETYSIFQQSIFDGQQLAFKVTANSLYGQLGAKTSDIYYKEIAASSTATGRDRLVVAKEYAENPMNYPQVLDNGETIYLQNDVVYGDTDSIFVKYQCLDSKGNKLHGRECRKRSIELAIYTDKQIQANILKAPQVLEYEKTFDPFILLSKKRYVGNLYEEDPDKFVLKSMGIVLKRRDNAPIVKVIYGGIIDIIMKEQDIKPSINFLLRALKNLVNGYYSLDTLIITKTLSSYYKDPERIAHKVLADRMAERDPGNKPQVNDRIPFVYIDTSHIKNRRGILQGDKIEHPQFVRDNKLSPDYEFYITNQILKPVSQIFGLCLEELPGFNGDIKEYQSVYDKSINSGKSINESIKKMLEAKRKTAANILFRDVLRRLENKRLGNTEITSFFRNSVRK